MKKSISFHHIKILVLLGVLPLFFAGCAPPPSSSGLQQRIDELLRIQQEQARQLEQLQQQLTGLNAPPATAVPPPETMASSPTLTTETQPADGAQLLPPPPSAAEIADLSQSAALYLESFAAIATGDMAAAEKGFSDFIARYPTSQYVGNARYWLAEALLALNQNQRGETLLLDIIDTPSEQQKAPAAMARLVVYYRKQGAADNAQAMLGMLSSRYPDSPELKRLLRSQTPAE